MSHENEVDFKGSSFILDIKWKRRLTYGTILMFNLSTGLGYAIIFPTIWNYIHERLGGQGAMLGVVVSAYSFSSLFANPLVGWWSDRTLNTRSILLITIFAEMVGSLLYFVGMHTWILVIGRLISGIGAGGGAAVIADITRTTSEEERTPVLSVVIASRQLGLIIGPAFNIFLSQLNFTILSLPVDKYTSPGLFMAMLWLLLEIMVTFTYYNLNTLKEDEDVERLFSNYNSIVTGSIPCSDGDNLSVFEAALISSYPPYSPTTSLLDHPRPGILTSSTSQPNLQVEWLEDNSEQLSSLKREEIETISCQQIVNLDFATKRFLPPKKHKSLFQRTDSLSDRMIESAERVIQSHSGSYQNYMGEDQRDRQNTANSRIPSTNPSTPYSEGGSFPDERTGLFSRIRQDYFRDEIVVLLGLSFISCFAQTVLETVVTPLAQKYYSFSEMDNSYIYLFAGIEVILVYAVIKHISRKVLDRSLIIFGLVALCCSTIIPIIVIPSAHPGDRKTLAYFILTIIVDLIGIAVIVVCSASLLSKLTSEDNQALLQGFRRSMCSLGCIVGPLWGGAFLFDIYFLFSVPLAVTALITVLLLTSYNKLNVDRI